MATSESFSLSLSLSFVTTFADVQNDVRMCGRRENELLLIKMMRIMMQCVRERERERDKNKERRILKEARGGN